MTSPEYGPQGAPEIPQPKETSEIENIEAAKTSPAAVQSKPPANVSQQTGPGASSNNNVTQAPADMTQLSTWAKGNPVNALTWFAVYWVRLIRKALGKQNKEVVKEEEKNAV